MPSSASLLESSTASSILGASGWDRQKETRARSVQGRPIMLGPIGGDDDAAGGDVVVDDETRHRQLLLKKRIYRPALGDDITSSDDDEKGNSSKKADEQLLTELETAVLLDCLSTNFLFSHTTMSKEDLQRYVLPAMEKVTFRTHEVIVKQGDPADFLYVLYQGQVDDGTASNHQEEEEKYTVFGELGMLTGSPHAVTVKAASATCTLFRLGRGDYQRRVLTQPRSKSSIEERIKLFQSAIPTELVDYLNEDERVLQNLVSQLSMHSFQKDEVLYSKTSMMEHFVIVSKGLVVMTNLSGGGRSYEDMLVGPGQSQTSFGWLSSSSSLFAAPISKKDESTMTSTVVAQTDGEAWIISKQAFANALGNSKSGRTITHKETLQHIAETRLARIQLQQITVFRDSALDDVQISGLLDLMHHCEYSEGEVILKAGEKVEAAMYFCREGSVTLELNKGESHQTIAAGGYFGENNMLLDQNKDASKHHLMRSTMTVTALSTNTTRLDVLYLEECRKVVDTTHLGLGKPSKISAIDASLRWTDISRHALLGSGSFGQVWLASITPAAAIDGEDYCEKRRIVALKIQGKHDLLRSDQAQHIVAERHILASLHSPFILRLFCAFQDEARLYMITSLLQGGELESIIPSDGLTESTAKFYAAGILEGLAYMHRRHIIHRDVKPENVLINEKGYPVLIDLGFAKYVPNKTYTFVGSPLFIAPEIIRYKGHDKACDYWSWAVVVYRMVTGKYPFYTKEMDELKLYKRICKGTFELDGLVSMEFRILMASILYPDPSKRLGSHTNGWREIFAAPWLANEYDTSELRSLHRQDLPAPWIPDLQDPLDASRFHPDASRVDDLVDEFFPSISEKEQTVFNSFGPQI